MLTIQKSLLIVLLFGLDVMIANVGFSQGRLDIIVDDSTIGPGGGTFNPSLAYLTMNNNGDLAFSSNQTGASTGMFFYDATTNGFSVIARIGDNVDGNGTFTNLLEPRLNESGTVSFAGRMTGTTGGATDDTALFRWLSSSSSLEVVVREGQSLGADMAEGVGITNLQVLSETDQIGFPIGLDTTAGSTSDYAIYSGDPGSLSELYRESSTISGFDTLISQPIPKFNRHGDVLIHSSYLNALGLGNGLFMSTGSSFVAIARAGDAAPEAGTYFQFGSHVLDDNGDVFYGASVNGFHNLYKNDDTLLAIAGGAAADGTENYGTFSGIGMTANNGEIAFKNTLDSGNQALFKTEGTDIIRIATQGQAAPDGNGFFDVWPILTATNFGSYALNAKGIVAFTNTLTGTNQGSADDSAIFLSDGIDLITVVREGDLIDGGTVDNLFFNAGRESDHKTSSSFNDFGQVGYRARIGGDWVIGTFTPGLHYRNPLDGSWDVNTNWTLSIEPDVVHDVFIDPTSPLTVFGPTTFPNVNTLQIGGNGEATLQLVPQTSLTTINGTTILPDGILTGEGGLNGHAYCEGVISPGSRYGALLFDDLTLAPTSEVKIELSGLLNEEYDQLLISGDAIFGGELTVDLILGFQLTEGMSFNIATVNGGTYTGIFDGLPDGGRVASFGSIDLFIEYGLERVTLLAVSTTPAVVPDSFVVTRGLLAAGGLTELADSDDLDFSMRRNSADIRSRAYVELTATSPTLTPSRMDFTLEAAVFARSQIDQTIELFDYVSGTFEVVDVRPANRFSDLVVVAIGTGDLSRFVSPTDSEVRARLRFDSINPRQQFTVNVDQAIWTIDP